MAAPVISISSGVSVERVGSSFSQVILSGSSSVEVPVTLEVGAAAVTLPAEVLKLDTHSSLEAGPSESSPPLVSVAPMVSPFLCADNSESDTKIPERHVSTTPHDAMLTRWRSRVASRSSSPTTSTLEIPVAPILPTSFAVVAPSSEFPLAPIVAPPRNRRQPTILIRPGEDIPIGRIYRTHPNGPCRIFIARKLVRPLHSHRLALRYTSHHLDHFTSESSSGHSSSDHLSYGHSILGHSLYGHTPPDTTVVDSSTPLMTSKSSTRDSSSESSTGPSLPSRADLLSPRKRFRDFISPKDSVKKDIDTDVLEDIKADATAVEVAVDKDVVAGKQYDAMIELHKCIRNASRSFKRNNQLLKLMQLLMGLDDFYMQIRSSILFREVLPDVRNAYAIISSEESHRVAAGSIVEASFYRSQILGFLSILLVIVSGQSGTLFRKGSACNRGYGHRLPSAYVLRKCLICVRLETFGRSQLISRLSGSSDPFPKSTQFNADDYAILVARPTLFQKFPKPFLCLTGMRCNYTLDEDTYPTFLHDDGTGGCLPTYIVQLVADPTKMKVGERERAIGEARLLDSTVGRVVLLLPVAPARAESELEGSVEKLFNEGGNVDQVDFVVGGGQEAEVGIATGVRIVAEENMATEIPRRPRKKRQAITNAGAVPTLPMVTSLVSATPGNESDAPSDSITGPNVRTIDASERSGIVPPVMTKVVVTSHVVDIPLVLEMDVKVTSPVQFIVGTARQAFLNAEVKMRTEYCLSERKRLVSKCEKKADLLKVRDAKIESLKARLLLKETEAAEVIHLRARVSTSEVMKKKHVSEIDALKQKNVAFENKKGSLDRKVVELQSLVSTKDLELKELNMHELEVTCCCERLSGYENLTDRLEEIQDAQLKVVNDKYLTIFGAAISRSIKKRMQDGLAVRIDHGREGMSLTDAAAYNPSAESDFNSALQELCKLDYPLLSELKSHKDASVEDIMNLLRLKGPHVDAP
nr:ribonuclease H-like domain-containing protein [Tanacetum cinerariifolium]